MSKSISRRKFLNYGAAVAATAAVVGAGTYLAVKPGGENVTQTITETATVAQTAASTPVAKWPDYSGQKLSIQMLESPFDAPQLAFNTIWKDRTGGDVEIHDVPWASWRDRTFIELTSGAGAFGLLMVAATYWKEDLTNYALDITNWINEDPPAKFDDWLPAVKQYGMTWPDGKIRALPVDFDVPTTFLRKDVFEKLGLKTETIRTPSTMIETLKALNGDKPTKQGGGLDLSGDGKIDFWAFGGNAGRRIEFQTNWKGLFGYYRGGNPKSGREAYFDEKGVPVIDSIEGVRALEDYVEMMKYAVPDLIGMDNSGTSAQMMQGHSGVFPNTGPGWRTTWRDAPDLQPYDEKMGYEMSMGRPPVMYGVGFVIDKNYKNPRMAYEYWKEEVEPDHLKAIQWGNPPWGPNWNDVLTKSGMNDPALMAAYPGFYEKASQNYAQQFWPAIDWARGSEYDDALDGHIVDALVGRVSAKDALRAAADDWKKLAG